MGNDTNGMPIPRRPERGSLPAVSVIMPCYNCARHVSRGIESALRQTYDDLEIIVIDDGSNDESADLIARNSDPRVRLIRQDNRGVSAARNAGLAAVRGEFVAFLDSDDTWEPDFVARLVDALRAHPKAALAYCGWQNLGVKGARGVPFVPPNYGSDDSLGELLTDCPWPIHAAMTRHAAITEAGNFDTHFAIGEDYLLWLEITAHGSIVRVPLVLAYYHFHGESQACANVLRVASETRRVKRFFLAKHPELAARLGKRRTRQLCEGRLLQTGYEHYWRRDLETARGIFRQVMLSGYGAAGDWLRMLPSLLPISMHKVLLRMFEDTANQIPRQGNG